MTLMEALREELRRHGLDLGEYEVEGHPIRWFEPGTAFSAPRMLLAGDAAGTDALYGEGISLALGYGAIVTRNEILLLLIGGVFVMELASVMLQVWYFRHTGGKRIFRCAPIHHHFHLAGWSEPQVVVRFWLLSIAFAVIALATLKLR